MKKKIALIMAAVLLIASMLAFAGCGKKDDSKPADDSSKNAAATDLDYIKEKGTLVVGVTEFEPMDYKDAGGNWIGFDADMATKFAESLGVKVEIKEIKWDNKVQELNGKTIDCVWNGMTLREDVLTAMECSKAYCNNAQVTVFKKADAEKYKSVNECKELTFAVEAGSAGEDQAKAVGFKTTPVEAQSGTLMEVTAGTSDAAIIDKLMALTMTGEGTNYADLTCGFDLNSEEYGVGFRKGSNLAEELNKFFDECRADGTMKQVAEKYKIADAIIL